MDVRLAVTSDDAAVAGALLAEFPLAEAAAALRFAERRGVVGKVVLTSGAPG